MKIKIINSYFTFVKNGLLLSPNYSEDLKVHLWKLICLSQLFPKYNSLFCFIKHIIILRLIKRNTFFSKEKRVKGLPASLRMHQVFFLLLLPWFLYNFHPALCVCCSAITSFFFLFFSSFKKKKKKMPSTHSLYI